MITTDLTYTLKDADPVKCGDCEWAGTALDMKAEIGNIAARIEPGGVVPAGQCPKCGALVYLITATTRRGDKYRRIRKLIESHDPVDHATHVDRLLGFAKTHTLAAMALMAAYHDSAEDGLPMNRFDAVHGLLFAAVLCACEKVVKVPGIDKGPMGASTMAFDRLNDKQHAALQELLTVADDMIFTTLDAVALSVPEGLEGAALDQNMTKQ